MQSNQIHEYFQIHKTKFENNFKIVKQTVQEEAIHDMRVSIKRLRLFYKFLDFYLNKQFNANKRSKILRKVFKSAAHLRDIQIQLTLLEDIEQTLNIKLTKWKNEFKKKENTKIEHLKEFLSEIDYIKINKQFQKSENSIKSVPANTDINTHIENYYNKCLAAIDQILKQEKIDYHKIRKKIKELTYLTEIQDIHMVKQNEKLNNLKQMGRLLGDWHDIDVFLKEQSLNNDDIITKYLKEKQNSLISNFIENYTSFINILDKN